MIIESEEEETKIPLLEEKRHAKKVQLRIELNIFEDAAEARRHNKQQMQQLTREAMILTPLVDDYRGIFSSFSFSC